MGRAASALRDRLVFAVGVRRSGTKWLQTALSAHPEITVVSGETYLFSHGIAPLAARFQHGIAGSARTGSIYMDRETFLDATRDFCDRVFEGLLGTSGGGRGLIAERTPDHVRHLDLIGAVYPDARVIHIVRDGRDVARSLQSQGWGPATVAEAAAEWRTGIEAGRRAAASLRRYREVRYEALLADTASELEDMYRWLGLDAGPEVVERAVAELDVPSNVDPASPVVGAGKWRDAWTAVELAEFTTEAGGLLADLGYSDGSTGPMPTSVPDKATTSLRSRAAAAAVAATDAWREPVGARSRSVDRRLTDALRIVEGLLEHVSAGRWSDVVGGLHPDALLRITGDGGEWVGRAKLDAECFLAALAADPVLTAPQQRSTVHPGLPSFTVLVVYATADGVVHPRTWVIGVRSGRVSELTLHRHGHQDPLPPTSSPPR